MMLAATLLTSCSIFQPSESTACEAFGDLKGSLVLIDCSSGYTTTFGPSSSTVQLPPCSTFKIVNALIGLETGIISSSDEQFYKWDGIERPIPSWNHDLTLLEAFQASCVPAFQALARQVGQDRMKSWIEKTGYGNKDISAGIDVFWLPGKGRNTIMISPAEQAKLMQKVVAGDVPFSKASLAVLKKLMFTKETKQGVLYGKTGSGTDEHGALVLGWFVGYVESNGKTYAFACNAQGNNVMSKNARAIVESFLERQGFL